MFKCYQLFRPSNVFLKCWLWPLPSCRQTRQRFSGEITEADLHTHELVALQWQVFYYLGISDMETFAVMKFSPSGRVTCVRYCQQPSCDNDDITLQTQTVSSQAILDPSEQSICLFYTEPGICHIITCILPFHLKTHRALTTLQELIIIPQIPCFALITHDHNTILCRY